MLVIFFSVLSCDTTEPSNAELMEKTLLDLSEVMKCISRFGIYVVGQMKFSLKWFHPSLIFNRLFPLSPSPNIIHDHES